MMCWLMLMMRELFLFLQWLETIGAMIHSLVQWPHVGLSEMVFVAPSIIISLCFLLAGGKPVVQEYAI